MKNKEQNDWFFEGAATSLWQTGPEKHSRYPARFAVLDR